MNMGQTAVAFLQTKTGFQHTFPLDMLSREAWAEYVRNRWPSNTAKFAAREWDLSLDQARGLAAGRVSLNTIDDITKHKNGGWSVLLPVMTAVIGESLDQHINKQRSDHAEQDRRRDALLRGLRTGNHASSITGY